MTTPSQMFAIVDESGNAVSFGTEVAPPEVLAEKKYTKIAVAAPLGPDEVWDSSSRKIVARTKTPAELKANDDKAFLDGIETKMKGKATLTQEERDRMLLIQLQRG